MNKKNSMISAVFCSTLLMTGCAAPASGIASSSPTQSSTTAPASVIWKVKPTYDYQSVKEITGSVADGYYGMKNYRKDLIAVSKDGIHYGIADYSGSVLIEPKYTTFDDKSYSLIGYGKQALLLGTESVHDPMNSPETMDEINSDLTINTVSFPTQIGGSIGPTLFYKADGSLCYFNGEPAGDTFVSESIDGYSLFASYENQDQTVILKDGQAKVIDHQLIFESPSYLQYPIVNGFVIYANKSCARIPTAEVDSEFSYGSWIPGGCSYKGFDTMNNGAKFGYYNKDGKNITEAVYDDAYFFTDGYAAVSKDGKYGYIDATGKEVVPMIFEKAMPLYQGAAWVCVNGKWGVLDLKKTLDAGIAVNTETISQ